jgi:hypothetical protein
MFGGRLMAAQIATRLGMRKKTVVDNCRAMADVIEEQLAAMQDVLKEASLPDSTDNQSSGQ